jgi:hypothetical protein
MRISVGLNLKSSRITAMEKVEIKSIAEYLKDLEEG